jgi:type IX secretion system PorP/SprF family membrane protein
MKRIVLLLFIMAGWAETALSQRDVQFTQYHSALNYYNPAAAGRTGDLNVTGLYRLQWVGWSNAPKTLFAVADMPFHFMKKEHGVGIVMTNDTESSAYSTMTVGLQYAFLKKIGKGTLRVGVQLGMVSMTVDGSNIILPVDSIGGAGAPDEAIPTTKTDAKAFDCNAGLFYATDSWYIGAATTHILEPEIDDENISTFISRGYNFIGGYNIKTNNPLLELQPSVFVKTNFNMYQVDLTARAIYAKRYNAGLAWRMNESIALMLGATFGKVEGGYAYDFPTSAIRAGTSGSHEFFLRYRMKLSKPKTGKSKHKSVRLL